MKRITAIVLFPVLAIQIHAMDWIIPDPISYEWTVRAASQAPIPKFTANDVTIKSLIAGLGDSMTFPLRIETLGIAEEKLEEKITIQREQIAWIEIVAIVADQIEADILITKGRVVLIPTTAVTSRVEPNGNTTRD